jgi:hypothetical protein
VSGWLAIAVLLRFVRSNSYGVFAVYRVLLGAVRALAQRGSRDWRRHDGRDGRLGRGGGGLTARRWTRCGRARACRS